MCAWASVRPFLTRISTTLCAAGGTGGSTGYGGFAGTTGSLGMTGGPGLDTTALPHLGRTHSADPGTIARKVKAQKSLEELTKNPLASSTSCICVCLPPRSRQGWAGIRVGVARLAMPQVFDPIAPGCAQPLFPSSRRMEISEYRACVFLILRCCWLQP